MHKRYLQSGFTMVEITVIIIIIGIISTIGYFGYNAYVLNAKKTQIANTVSTYQNALKAVAFENDKNPTTNAVICLSSNSSRCCNSNGGVAFMCGDNTYYNTAWPEGADLYNTTSKYLKDENTRKLPSISGDIEPCDGVVIIRVLSPCNQQEVAFIKYIDTSTTTVETDSPKGVIEYTVAGNIDCQSPNVMTYEQVSGSPKDTVKIKYTSNKYTYRLTPEAATPPYKPYTFCMVGIP